MRCHSEFIPTFTVVYYYLLVKIRQSNKSPRSGQLITKLWSRWKMCVYLVKLIFYWKWVIWMEEWFPCSSGMNRSLWRTTALQPGPDWFWLEFNSLSGRSLWLGGQADSEPLCRADTGQPQQPAAGEGILTAHQWAAGEECQARRV